MNLEQAKEYYKELAEVINPILNEILPLDEQIEVTDPIELEEYLIELLATWLWQTMRKGVTGVSVLPISEFEKLDEVKDLCTSANKVKRNILKGDKEKAFVAVVELIEKAGMMLFLCGFKPSELVAKLRKFAEENDTETQNHRFKEEARRYGWN